MAVGVTEHVWSIADLIDTAPAMAPISAHTGRGCSRFRFRSRLRFRLRPDRPFCVV